MPTTCANWESLFKRTNHACLHGITYLLIFSFPKKKKNLYQKLQLISTITRSAPWRAEKKREIMKKQFIYWRLVSYTSIGDIELVITSWCRSQRTWISSIGCFCPCFSPQPPIEKNSLSKADISTTARLHAGSPHPSDTQPSAPHNFPFSSTSLFW